MKSETTAVTEQAKIVSDLVVKNVTDSPLVASLNALETRCNSLTAACKKG